MDRDFHRIRRLPPYLFAEVNEMKARARAAGEDIIDFGMGNPDRPPRRPMSWRSWSRRCSDPKRPPLFELARHSRGCGARSRAYYERRFGVTDRPRTRSHRHPGLQGRFRQPRSWRLPAPGDVVIVPNPSYPIHAYGFIIAGGVGCVMFRSVRAIDFLSEIERAARYIPCHRRPLAVILNFPANPTAHTVDLGFYERGRRFL